MTPEEIETLLFEVDSTRIGADSARRILALIAEMREACAKIVSEYAERGLAVVVPAPYPETGHIPLFADTEKIAAAIRAHDVGTGS
jgi:hypothetical protein